MEDLIAQLEYVVGELDYRAQEGALTNRPEIDWITGAILT